MLRQNQLDVPLGSPAKTPVSSMWKRYMWSCTTRCGKLQAKQDWIRITIILSVTHIVKYDSWNAASNRLLFRYWGKWLRLRCSDFTGRMCRLPGMNWMMSWWMAQTVVFPGKHHFPHISRHAMGDLIPCWKSISVTGVKKGGNWSLIEDLEHSTCIKLGSGRTAPPKPNFVIWFCQIY
jgi:hypothetical protein